MQVLLSIFKIQCIAGMNDISDFCFPQSSNYHKNGGKYELITHLVYNGDIKGDRNGARRPT